MDCRPHCAACCIVPSISSAIPGMPQGKPSEVSCPQLTEDLQCRIFGKPERPLVCASLKASQEMCGDCAQSAFAYLRYLEKATSPAP